jgi:cytochrome-b5 reductase
MSSFIINQQQQQQPFIRIIMDFINNPENLPILAVTATSMLLGTAVLLYVVAKHGNKKQDNGSSSNNNKRGQNFLNRTRQSVKLIEKIIISHDTRLFRFGLPNKSDCLGLPTGKHITVYCPNPKPKIMGQWNKQEDKETGKEEIERKYTPTTSDNDKGYFDLVIKVYSAQSGNDARFPDGGKMSQYMDTIPLGGSIDIMGPFGLIEYLGHGVFKKGRKEILSHNVGMLAGGTGITPMLQIIEAILRDPYDRTTISLIYANQTEADILVRERLEELQSKHGNGKFKIWYTLDRPPPPSSSGWKYSSGFISSEMIQQHLPLPKPDTVILMCGPPPMMKFMKNNLDGLGYDKDLVLEF